MVPLGTERLSWSTAVWAENRFETPSRINASVMRAQGWGGRRAVGAAEARNGAADAKDTKTVRRMIHPPRRAADHTGRGVRIRWRAGTPMMVGGERRSPGSSQEGRWGARNAG